MFGWWGRQINRRQKALMVRTINRANALKSFHKQAIQSLLPQAPYHRDCLIALNEMTERATSALIYLQKYARLDAERAKYFGTAQIFLLQQERGIEQGKRRFERWKQTG